jgi:hypothetical protein
MRYAANLLLVEQALTRTLTDLDAARLHGDEDRIAFLTARVAALEDLLRPRFDPLTRTERARQFLLFDDTGLGRVAEVIGDLDTAAHVSVSVPGMTAQLNGYYAGFAGDVYRLAAQVDVLSGGSGDAAVIAWMGYEAPQWDPPTAVLSQDLAHRGAPGLADLMLGLPDTGATTTVIAHSYGSVVAGLAMRDHGMAPDNVVLIGSPGPAVDHVSGFGLPDSSDVYAARGPLDAIVHFGPHGADPTDPRFGATRLEVGPLSSDDPMVYWHSAYYQDGSHSLQNLALLTLDADAAVTTVDPTITDRAIAAVDLAQEGIGDLHDRADDLIDRAQDLPLVTTPLGDVFVDWMQEAAGQQRQELDRAVDAGQALVDRASDLGHDVFDLGRQAGPRVRDWAGDRVDDVTEGVEDGVDWVGDQAGDLVDRLDPRGWF